MYSVTVSSVRGTVSLSHLIVVKMTYPRKKHAPNLC